MDSDENPGFEIPASIKKPVLEYRPPIERVCAYCGKKHYGPFRACSSCKAALDSGDSR